MSIGILKKCNYLEVRDLKVSNTQEKSQCIKGIIAYLII